MDIGKIFNTVAAGILLAIAGGLFAIWMRTADLETWKEDTHPLETEIAHEQLRVSINSAQSELAALETEIQMLEAEIGLLRMQIREMQ